MTRRPLSAVLARLIMLCMAPMVLIAIGFAWHDMREEAASESREAGNLARSFATGVDSLLDDRVNGLKMLARSRMASEERDWPAFFGEAMNYLVSFESHVIFADDNGRMLFNTRRPYGTPLPSIPVADPGASASRAIQSGRPQVSDIVMGSVAKSPLLTIVVPVVREGRPTRLLLTAIELGRFQDRIDSFVLPAGASIALQDSTGADIARRSPPGFNSARDVDASDRHVVRASLAPWSVVLEIPRSVHRAHLFSHMLVPAAAIFLAILMALAGGIWTRRQISKQVATLGDPALGASQGVEIVEIHAARLRIVEAVAQAEAVGDRLRLWGEAFIHMEVGLAISDARTNTLITVNPAFARQRGYSEEELVGQSSWKIFPPDRQPALRPMLPSRDRAGHVVFETEHLRKDGTRFPVMVDATIICAPDGTPINRLALVLDISDRKRAEQELAERQAGELETQRQAHIAALNLMEDAQAAKREAEASAEEVRRLSQVVEQSVESIEITDLENRITYVNEAFLRQTGYSREEVLGRDPRFLQSGKTPRESYVALRSALLQGNAWRGELYNRRKDGSEFIEYATIVPIRRSDGQITHYVAVKEDVTERKRMGAELDSYRYHLEQLVAERTTDLELARAHAEAANRAKTTFLTSMSHEIRTPMNAILGFTHMLKRDAASSVEADRLDKIEDAAKHLLSVINNILDLSKIEAGKLELEVHDFALEAVLGHVEALIGEGAAAKGLVVHVDADHVARWFRGDLTRLRQAMLNLAGNAVKFTEKGSITLRARLLESKADRSLLRFEVEDSGIGIPAEALPQLFHAFQQVDASTTRRFGGTGLGLVITRELARAMGGDAGAQSTRGAGSLFWFTAMLEHGAAPRAASARINADELRRRHAGARVLLAEDHAINREVAADLLQAAGLSVRVATNGREAVEMAREGGFDLILMDMLMPEMDGLEATRAIREMSQGRVVPIIAMTANAFEEDRKACQAAGMSDFVAKPVDLQTLYQAIDRWLSVVEAEASPGKVDAEPAVVHSGVAVSVSDTSAVMSRLSREAGLDLGKGLAIFNGKEDKLIGLLRMMATAHRNDIQKIQSCLHIGAHDEAQRIAHTLRGVAAMLGVNSLFLAVGDLEARLRETPVMSFDEVAGPIAAANQQLEQLLEIVGKTADSR